MRNVSRGGCWNRVRLSVATGRLRTPGSRQLRHRMAAISDFALRPELAGPRHWRDLIQRPLYTAGQPSRCEGLPRIVVPPFRAGAQLTLTDPLPTFSAVSSSSARLRNRTLGALLWMHVTGPTPPSADFTEVVKQRIPSRLTLTGAGHRFFSRFNSGRSNVLANSLICVKAACSRGARNMSDHVVARDGRERVGYCPANLGSGECLLCRAFLAPHCCGRHRLSSCARSLRHADSWCNR